MSGASNLDSGGTVGSVTIGRLSGRCCGCVMCMLSSGLTLIFRMMGVLNCAQASVYMGGAYVAYSIASLIGFWPGLFIAPFVVAALGAAFAAGMGTAAFEEWSDIGRFVALGDPVLPNTAAKAVYDERYRVYRELYGALKAV